MTDVEQIKEKVDIVSFISEYVALKKTGANFKGVCPFHSEKTPSFIVSPERGIWHCFGGCNDGGDVFKFLMRVENIDFSEALKILAERAGVKLTGSLEKSKTAEIRERILAANKLASEFYQYILTSHDAGKVAKEYLVNRGISENSIKLFGIGYSPNTWRSLTQFLFKKGFVDRELEQAGLISRSGIGNNFDRFRGRVMFSLCDHRGNVVGFAGRVLDRDAKEAKYINTIETPVYIKGDQLYGLNITKEEIKKAGFAVVVEGEIDTIQSYQAGVRNVVGIKGSALTNGQINLLRRYTDQIYLSLDSDFAGDAASHRGIEAADNAGLSVKVVEVVGAKDPDELIRKDPSLWHKAVKEAIPYYDFLINSAVLKNDVTSALGAKKIVSDLARFIYPIENLVVKAHYIKKIAKILGISEDDLETQLGRDYRKFTQGTVKNTDEIPDQNRPKTRLAVIEEYLLSIILQSERPSDYLILIAPRLTAEDFTEVALGKIYHILWSLFTNPKSDVVVPEKAGIKYLSQFVPDELIPLFDRLYLSETKVDMDNENEVLREVQKTTWQIKELSIRNYLRQLTDKIRVEPENEELAAEFTDTTIKLQKLLEEKKLLDFKGK